MTVTARAVKLDNRPLPQLSIFIDRRLFAMQTIQPEWSDYTFQTENIPYDNGEWIVELRAPTFRPQSALPDSTDTRELGVMLSSIELK